MTLVVRAPDVDSDFYANNPAGGGHIVVNTANDDGTFGGLALNITIRPDAAEVKKLIYVQK